MPAGPELERAIRVPSALRQIGAPIALERLPTTECGPCGHPHRHHRGSLPTVAPSSHRSHPTVAPSSHRSQAAIVPTQRLLRAAIVPTRRLLRATMRKQSLATMRKQSFQQRCGSNRSPTVAPSNDPGSGASNDPGSGATIRGASTTVAPSNDAESDEQASNDAESDEQAGERARRLLRATIRRATSKQRCGERRASTTVVTCRATVTRTCARVPVFTGGAWCARSRGPRRGPRGSARPRRRSRPRPT